MFLQAVFGTISETYFWNIFAFFCALYKPPKDVQLLLGQLVCLNGFQTSPDVPGCEKVCCTTMKKSWILGSAPPQVDIGDLGVEGLLGPQSLFMVKGWNRVVAALGVLMAAWETPGMLEAGHCWHHARTSHFKRDVCFAILPTGYASRGCQVSLTDFGCTLLHNMCKTKYWWPSILLQA